MKMARRIGIAAALIAAAGLLVPAMAAEMKVKDFVVRVAEAKELPATSCDGAVSSLRQAGFNLPALSCDSALTEGDVAAISNSLGIRVTTSQPDAMFSEAQVDSYFAAFARQVGTAGVGTDDPGKGNGADPLQKGKGKKKGLRSPDDPV